jgi:hypothetical protein
MSEIKCSILEMKAVFELLLENPTMSARTACARHGVRYRSFLKRTRQPEHEAHYIRTREFQQTLALEDMDDRFPESGASMKALKAFKKEAYKLDYQLKKLKPRRLMSRKPVDPLKQQMRDAQRRAKTHAPTPTPTAWVIELPRARRCDCGSGCRAGGGGCGADLGVLERNGLSTVVPGTLC